MPAEAQTGESEWRNGWWTGSPACPSPNRGARPTAEVSLVVLHSISLPPGVYGGGAIDQLFTNRLDCDAHPYFQTLRGLRVSAHFLVRRDGTIMQYVSCDDRAWHAGLSSWQGRDNCNDYSVGVELEGLEGDAFGSAQYDALLPLLRAICARYPVQHVVGHEHVAPGRKTDPGPGFDWRRLREHWRADPGAASPWLPGGSSSGV